MRGAKSAKWVAIAAVVALGATACGGGSGDSGNDNSNAAVDPKGIFSVDVGEPQNPLQPANAKESNGSKVIKAVFSQLVDFDDKGKIVYENAESIKTEDNKVWTVTLKDGWKFHNGEAVTAKSYVDAWNWAANIKNNQTNSYWFADIKGFEDVHPEKGDPKADAMSGLKVVDDKTFTIELSSPIPYFEYKLGYDVWSPLPSGFFKDPAAFGEKPVGNGPYEFVKWEHKKQIELKTYADYKGADKPKNGGVILKNYTTVEAGYQDLLSNNLDVIRQIGPKDLPKRKADLGDRAVDQDYNAVQTITPAFYTKQWKDIDPKVLQGLSMAIDRETITKTVLNGTREPASSFAAKGVAGYQAGVAGDILTYNPDKAKQYIKDGGGVPGNKITIQFNADGGHKEWVEAVCNSIRKATGVDCVGDSKPDFQTDLDARDAKEVKSMYRGGWVQDYPLNVNFMRDLYGSKADGNTSGFADKEIDALFKKGDNAKDLDSAIAAYQEAEKAMFEKMPSIPLWYYKANFGYSTNVKNVKFDNNGDPVLTDIEVLKK
ncbi:ABC transporter substrate-binding protein [Streptomyces sp. SID9913]|uniref:peptide ABC transporter substrate-binding protein n=1 Tax=unclassified Streptomyces TaxID=2593676 RepID=UPI0013BF6731|nr:MULTISPECIES: ABC transporter substrate-binding protein [unclassified Streptomyces]NEC29934.1 ABC transporter substrate-binding protein [Streptomyces sp. SID8111]NED22948.1 ABC transporter substrate-binding protein [Streptomyces sp. SID9913]